MTDTPYTPYFHSLTHPPPPTSTLFPYTTLFRSPDAGQVFLRDQQLFLARTRPLNIDSWEGALVDQLAVENDFQDRKSTRLNSSHVSISYAVFCLKKKKIYFQYIARSRSLWWCMC